MVDAPLIPEQDKELSVFLAEVVELAESSLETEEFLGRISELGAQFDTLKRFRKPAVLKDRLKAFARSRLQLAEELARGGKEVLVLTMVLVHHSPLIVPALKETIVLMSGGLRDEESIQVFGKLLKRGRAVAKAAEDEDFLLWINGVIEHLPE